MIRSRWSPTLCAAALALASSAHAETANFQFSGPGVSGSLLLTYGAAVDSIYPNAFEITGISGTFSDSNGGLNIVNAAVGPLIAITHATPEDDNLLAPHDFSRFGVATGLPFGTSLSFDNLYWPAGSPPTATDYPFGGGVLDIYGLLFSIGGSQVVNVWSAGDLGGGVTYGAAVATADKALDYVETGIAAVPEPDALWMLGAGLLAIGVWRKRARRA